MSGEWYMVAMDFFYTPEFLRFILFEFLKNPMARGLSKVWSQRARCSFILAKQPTPTTCQGLKDLPLQTQTSSEFHTP